MSQIEVPIGESKIGGAFDKMFDYIGQLFGTDDLVLNNIATTLDIREQAPFYSMQGFRSYIDRRFARFPIENDRTFSELARPVNASDRFSTAYRSVVSQAVTKLQGGLDDSEVVAIAAYEAEIDSQRDKLLNKEEEAFQKWAGWAVTRGMNPNSAEAATLLERASFYDRMGYFESFARIQDRMDEARLAIETIRLNAFDTQDEALIRVATEISRNSNQPQFPYDPQVEELGKLTYFQMLTMAASGSDYPLFGRQLEHPSLPSVTTLWDVEPPTDPNAKLDGFEVTRDETIKKHIEKRWKVRGSVRKFLFFKARASASRTQVIKESIKSVHTIGFHHHGHEEVLAVRPEWWDPQIFDHPAVIDILKSNRRLAVATSYIINSLVLLRGIRLSLAFEDSRSKDELKSFAGSLGGGASFFGIKFGARGQTSGREHVVRELDNGIGFTISDDYNHWRVVGYRVQRVHDLVDDGDIAGDLSSNIKLGAFVDALISDENPDKDEKTDKNDLLNELRAEWLDRVD